jgi:hypothetical protein
MRTIRYIMQVLHLFKRRIPPGCPDVATKANFYAKLEEQFLLVQERQRQHAAGLWRATDDCPGPFRIQAGDLSPEEVRHVNECHLCWLIYDLTRFDRLVSALQQSGRKTARWFISEPLAPILVGLLVIMGIFALHLRAVGQGTRTVPPASPQHLSSGAGVRPLAVRASAYDRKKERRRLLELFLRRLPPDVEMQVRLGPRLQGEFDSLREVIALRVAPGSSLGQRLDQSWLDTLRLTGNGLFIDVVREQAAVAPRIDPGSLVKLAEIHTSLARRVSPRYFRALLLIQARIMTESTNEGRRTRNPGLVGERVLREAAEELKSASPAALGEAGALRSARDRRVAASSLARR